MISKHATQWCNQALLMNDKQQCATSEHVHTSDVVDQPLCKASTLIDNAHHRVRLGHSPVSPPMLHLRQLSLFLGHCLHRFPHLVGTEVKIVSIHNTISCRVIENHRYSSVKWGRGGTCCWMHGCCSYARCVAFRCNSFTSCVVIVNVCMCVCM